MANDLQGAANDVQGVYLQGVHFGRLRSCEVLVKVESRGKEEGGGRGGRVCVPTLVPRLTGLVTLLNSGIKLFLH